MYTEQIVRDPLVENQEVENRIPVEIPGKQIFRERFVQPINHIEQQILNI